MLVGHSFLFNFAASYAEGGYKRLHEYARWFDSRGGASFVIHPRCEQLRAEFPGNRYFVVAPSHLKRLYDDCSYLESIRREIGQPDLYYSYGIPLYRRFGRINWFHLQNILAIGRHDVPLSLYHRAKFHLLGARFRRGFDVADVIAAESRYSLRLVGAAMNPAARAHKLFLAVNGSDDELAVQCTGPATATENVAVAIGTFSYKAVQESLRLFETIRESRDLRQLILIGDARPVPARVRRHPLVRCVGRMEHGAVIEQLRRSSLYISSTYVENSYNGASEGAFLASESFISDIPPHRELLVGEDTETVRIPGLQRSIFHVRRERLRGVNLKSWHMVISEMLARLHGEALDPAALCDMGGINTESTAANEGQTLGDRPRQRSPG